jgi:6-phosphofructokinase
MSLGRKKMVVILDPQAEPGVPVDAYNVFANVRRRGVSIALVSNGFPDATNLMNAVGRALEARLDSPRIQLFERFNATILADREVIQEISKSFDVAVTAMGHCGSCTSSAVRDAVNIARCGIPAVALVSEKFLAPAQSVARSVGLPDIPRAKLPHPVAGSGLVRIQAIADSVVDDIIAAWEGEKCLKVA